MPEVDAITPEGKNAIATLLNEGLQVEYDLIINYPRIVDQLVNIDKVDNKQFIQLMERFGKESFKHSGLVGR